MNNAQQSTGSSRVGSTIAWGLAPIVWFLAFVGWIWADAAFGSPVLTDVYAIAILALPAPWLLWASWRMPRPALKSYVVEAGALLTGLISLYITVLAFMLSRTGPAPIAFTAIFFAAAVVFVAAAWPLPGRRIAYGAAALACVILGIGLRVLHSGTSYYPGIDFMTKDELFAAAFLGLPALGALLQVGWWLRGKARAA